MATKIRRCLYIGLGGTGMTALLHTKRAFIDTYGEVPPMVSFLGVDSDSGAYTKELLTGAGQTVTLTPNEQFRLAISGQPQDYYQVSNDKFAWLDTRNVGSLDGLKNLGCGQIRSNGRFSFTINYDNLRNKVTQVINEITNAAIANNLKYDLLSEADVEVHIVFSIAGGTGSGTFLNMAYLVRDIAPNSKVVGYAVLPEVFRAMSQTTMTRVRANGYGSLLDLDYCMQITGPGQFELAYLQSTQAVNRRPFNSVVFIDNKNSSGDTYTHVDQLAEMISLALVTAAGRLSAAGASTSDNLEQNIRNKVMDIENKLAWAGGMGAAEIIFRGNDLAAIYALKASNWIAEDMLRTAGQDNNQIANTWIDANTIRENDGRDDVIDYLLAKLPKYAMSAINDVESSQAEVDAFVNMNQGTDAEVRARVESLQQRVEQALDQLVVDQLNRPNGVANSEKILDTLEAQFKIMLQEMNTERDALMAREPQEAEAVKGAVGALIEIVGRFFKLQSTVESHKQDVMDAGYALAVTRREIRRRAFAIQFYNYLLTLVAAKKALVADTRKKLNGVMRDNEVRLARLQNGGANALKLFQINLAASHVNSISVNPAGINVVDMIQGLSDGMKVHEWAVKSNDNVAQAIYDYTSGLNDSMVWRNMGVADVLAKIKRDDPARFASIVQLALRKSMPLFSHDYRGYVPQQQPNDIIYIGIPGVDCVLNRDAVNENYAGHAEVSDAVIGMDDRIIIYRQFGVVPAYTITSIGAMKSEYELTTNVSCRIDAGLERRMERDNFALEPSRAIDNSLELWVKGFVLGLVRLADDGSIIYQDFEEGDPIDNFMVNLGKYRDEAFAKFRTGRKHIEKLFNDEFDKMIKTRGSEYVDSIIDRARQDTFYMDNYVRMSPEQLRAHGNEGILALVREELTYVSRNL